MRKYLLGIMAIVIAIPLSAFTSTKQDASKNQESLYWFEYNPVTETTGLYLDYGVWSDFTTGSCHVEIGLDCRRGYPAWDLKNQADPSLGVIYEDLHSDRIGRHGTF